MQPEEFVDKNADNLCNNGENFTDIHGNGTWDTDSGVTGQGGSEDVTQYTMTVTYPRLFPVATLMGWPSTMSIASTTLLQSGERNPVEVRQIYDLTGAQHLRRPPLHLSSCR